MALAIPALGGVDPDFDSDGVPDHLDNGVEVPNAAPNDCDSDQDGYGNACDADSDQGLTVNARDWKFFLQPDFAGSGVDSGEGTDMNCDGVVSGGDIGVHFVPAFQTGEVGPSGLSCAGVPPCS